jgi:translation initiation factor IF-2
VIPEEWGGDYQFVHVSALTGDGIDAARRGPAAGRTAGAAGAARRAGQGIVIESRLDKGRGPVASLLVQSGTLRQGDMVLAGLHYGRVRAMLDENGSRSKRRVRVSRGDPRPDGTPDAGDQFAVLERREAARELADFRQEKMRENKLQRQQAASSTTCSRA